MYYSYRRFKPYIREEKVTNLSWFALLAFLLSAGSYIPYVRAIFGGKARPTISAWLSWFIVDAAIFFAAAVQGEVLYQVAAYVVGCLIIIGACLYIRAPLGWTRLDTICTALVVVAIILWVSTGDADVAIVIGLTAMTIGSLPMFVNVWQDPAREPILPWLLNLGGALCGFAAIEHWTIAGALSPVIFLSLSVLFNLNIWRQLLHKQASA